MPLIDLISVFTWWIVLFLIGIIFFPLTAKLFPRFFDKGYIFSKIIGLILLAYILLLGGVLHILPFTKITIILLLVVIAVATVYRFIRVEKGELYIKPQLLHIFSKNVFSIIAEELLFAVSLYAWSYVRAFNPDIHGLEKFMDFGFVNSILRSTYFPPTDMWFPPFSINYYYFGHLVTALITKLSNLPSYISFNLMLATLFAFAITCSFSLGTALFMLAREKETKVKPAAIIAGVVSAFLVGLGGNLHTIYTFFKAYPNDNPVPFWQLPFSPNTFSNSYWYPNATRFIFHTIHEFPIYSFVVSDLHGHVLAIPFALLTIALILSLFTQREEFMNYASSLSKKASLSTNIKQLFKHFKLPLFSIGFLLAILYMTNSFDGITYFILITATIYFVHWQWREQNKKFSISDFSFYPTVILATIAVSAIIFSLPFSLFFKPFVSGIGVLCAPSFLVHIGKIGPFLFEANHCEHSPWWQLLILYGGFYFWALSLFVFLLKKKKQASDIFALLLVVVSTILIIIPEFIYFKDIYPTYYRANTMFKLVYQAFIMLSLVSSYSIVRIFSLIKARSFKKITGVFIAPWIVIAVFFCFLVAIYPYFAIFSYYNNLTNYKGLNGITYLQTQYPDDYQAILWLNKNIKGQPVILEAQGDSYTDYARISANTGLPTVLGWTVHEWLWRGTYDIPAPRIADVKTLYESTDLQTTENLLKKYHVSLVYVGTLERQKYPSLDEAKWASLGHIIFQIGNTRLYKLNQVY